MRQPRLAAGGELVGVCVGRSGQRRFDFPRRVGDGCPPWVSVAWCRAHPRPFGECRGRRIGGVPRPRLGSGPPAPKICRAHPAVPYPQKCKSRTPSVTVTMVTLGSPAFLISRIRDFPPLPLDRFRLIVYGGLYSIRTEDGQRSILISFFAAIGTTSVGPTLCQVCK